MLRDLGLRPAFVAFLSILFISCNQFTFTPRSKAAVRREKPSLTLLTSIIDYRLDQHGWPVSKEDFMNKGKKYHDAFNYFRYTYTNFKIIDSNTMIFYFSGHIADEENYNRTRQVDLNALGGSVKFFWVKDRFAWKVKMN